ncbi:MULTISPECIES: CDGSH iron-sulfur domain-containing protein [unclassified Streptomyces]|uniref:CDGSH iron-sulfur domain-containing protein n=1 Tax=unclassified Streptomyces TaxID=2593676 RepID=UPI001654E9CE|nr:CDGSH iron-sulfur domain-containing protein [Streptomyces sp. CB02980]MCB8901099.1 CDGSH iron-sulfur domain-containing protein [Streptomyces sp. CB02980]
MHADSRNTPGDSRDTPGDSRKSRGPARAEAPAHRAAKDLKGPVLVEGPVEIVLDDGTVARSERFMVALCTCRRSRIYPWCDTSHRPRERAVPPSEDRNPS